MIKWLLRLLGGMSSDWRDLIDKGAIVLDVRSASEYHQGHVKGSKHIPLQDIEKRIDEITSYKRPIITCCASGIRSASAARILRRHGIEVANGGSWQSVQKGSQTQP